MSHLYPGRGMPIINPHATPASIGAVPVPVDRDWATFVAMVPATFPFWLVHITDAGMESLWLSDLTGVGTYAWECLWSAWYLPTGTIPAAVPLLDGVECYDSTLGVHMVCQATGAGTAEWIAVGSGSVRCLRKALTPAPATNYNGPGIITVIPTGTYTPIAGRKGLQFVFAKLPPVIGNVFPGIRVTFITDAGVVSTVTTYNALPPAFLYVPDVSVDWNKDGQQMTQVEFLVNNTGVAQVQTVGEFQVHGWWV